MTTEVFMNQLHGAECFARSGGIGADGQCQWVKNNILFVNTVFGGNRENALGNSYAVLGTCRNTALIKGKRDHESAIFFDKRKDGFHAFHLAIDRVDHGFAVVAAKRCLHCHRIGGVDLQGQVCDLLQARDGIT